MKLLSHVQLFATPWTIAYQAPLSMEFSRQEYWNGLPFPSPGDLPEPGIEPGSPALQTDTVSPETPAKQPPAPVPTANCPPPAGLTGSPPSPLPPDCPLLLTHSPIQGPLLVVVITLFPRGFSFSPPCGHTIGLYVLSSCASCKKKDVC